MKTADEILDEELNETMKEILKNDPIFKEWIKDAMYKYHSEQVKNNVDLADVSKQRELLIDFYKFMQKEVGMFKIKDINCENAVEEFIKSNL